MQYFSKAKIRKNNQTKEKQILQWWSTVFSEDNPTEVNLSDSFLNQFKHIIPLSLVKKYAEKLLAIKSIVVKTYTNKWNLKSLVPMLTLKVWKELMKCKECSLNTSDPQFWDEWQQMWRKISSANLINYKYYNYLRR